MVCYAQLSALFTEKYFWLMCLFLWLYNIYFTYKIPFLKILKIIFCTLFNLLQAFSTFRLYILLMQPTQQSQENNKN
jgi:hypothetical protein